MEDTMLCGDELWKYAQVLFTMFHHLYLSIGQIFPI